MDNRPKRCFPNQPSYHEVTPLREYLQSLPASETVVIAIKRKPDKVVSPMEAAKSLDRWFRNTDGYKSYFAVESRGETAVCGDEELLERMLKHKSIFGHWEPWVFKWFKKRK